MKKLVLMFREFFIVLILFALPLFGSVSAINNYLIWKDDYYVLGVDMHDAVWFYLTPYLFSIFVLIVYKRTRR